MCRMMYEIIMALILFAGVSDVNLLINLNKIYENVAIDVGK